ncbi:hypothetical protein DERF_004666 [Dermatophagoides farinae]|uniref:Uncharacterized protein n=1 Tax=Dermatophagoides farinae TaxID=6954 RepID=A0A922L5F9_DERFA|nr:hypothetical protein DERF_004666 [Dermatophagoides farinae]
MHLRQIKSIYSINANIPFSQFLRLFNQAIIMLQFSAVCFSKRKLKFSLKNVNDRPQQHDEMEKNKTNIKKWATGYIIIVGPLFRFLAVI